MIRHCDGECGKHDCYVGFLEARLTEVERERDRLQADLDVVDSDLSLAVKRLTADNNRLYDEKAKLRKALEGLFKPSTPYAQWTVAEHEAQIVLEQTGKKW